MSMCVYADNLIWKIWNATAALECEVNTQDSSDVYTMKLEFFTTAIHNSYIIKMYNYRGSNVAMIITIDDALATHFTN